MWYASMLLCCCCCCCSDRSMIRSGIIMIPADRLHKQYNNNNVRYRDM